MSWETSEVLRRLIQFKATYDTIKVLINDANDDWRAFVTRLHSNYPVKATGVKAHRVSREESGEKLLVREQDVDPSGFAAFINEFPLGAAAASYLFSILEEHGNLLVEISNKKYFRERGVPRNAAWHHRVWGDADLDDTNLMRQMRLGYGRPFRQELETIGRFAAHRLIILKGVRNAFIHELHEAIEFDRFFALVIGVVCDLEFMLVPESVLVKEFPFEQINEEWGRNGPPYLPINEDEELDELIFRGEVEDHNNRS